MPPPTHDFVSHVSEVQLRLEADAVEDLYAEAARALGGLLAEPDAAERLGPSRPVRVTATDRAGLLAEWINELVFLSETEKLVFREIRIESASETELVASVRGAEPREIRTAIKAATYHDLSVERSADGRWHATVVLDA
jgi:SHS2 domain-containing protein